MSEELKPCPHCGGTIVYTKSFASNAGDYSAVCSKCRAEGGNHKTREAAATAWNHRAGEKQH